MAAPAKTKAMGKIGRTRIYVSFKADPDTPEQDDWVERFLRRLRLMGNANWRDVLKTGEIESGELFAEHRPTSGTSRVSEVIGILTDTYMEVNTDLEEKKAEGELARVFDCRFGKAERFAGLNIFLAPLMVPNWKLKVREVVLSDNRLIRLRDSRFLYWRDEKGPSVVPEQIAEAIDHIFNTVTDATGHEDAQ